MTERVTFDGLRVEPHFVRVLTEDGPYDTQRGAVVQALLYRETAMGVADDVYELQHVFESRESAERCVERIEAAGDIDLQHWAHIDTVHRNRVPDWATPEYAARERMECGC